MTLMVFKLGKPENVQKMMKGNIRVYSILFSFHVYPVGIWLYKAFKSLQTAAVAFFYTQ